MMVRPRSLPQVWGVLNVTPDSFSDGGRFRDLEAAVAHGVALAAEGADVVDVGGESTRPGAEPVSEAEEMDRVLPVLGGLAAARTDARLSIDTRHAAVADVALAAGASVVNDVSAGGDPEMFGLVAARGADLVLMHMLGQPRSMQQDPHYVDVVEEVRDYLLERAEAAMAAGVAREKLWIDPGIGFGKTLGHNLALLRALEGLVATGYRVLLGASRKSFIGALTEQRDPAQRLAGSLACALRALEAGVQGVRVHDVRATRDALQVFAHVR